ncbi:crotonyl-CoA carboxylase/reductase [Saccharothrix sp. 6-C]|uniref:Crotonyl-CoA carboxylase/reductase n=1 Tax=Saccharothrix texasensis TaxID=103734 RepID=A0A3N1GZA5_9PSEU|nr:MULTISPECIES: crotonyl-CoA carboxylase/reductase [Saccharothrix]QQQ79992.1 crotonyl-CoA carboxylase/reductase [Saccharothrix sp. 6-C]ROP35577.1 crotonyl-CoA carboxylase/reductase [Saccharothrix texasensis]
MATQPATLTRTDTLYEPGSLPPLGVVPRRMYASVIRPERYGPPSEAFRTEVVDVPEVPPGFVLVAVMAAGINYNNVWAALGTPVDVIGMREAKGDDTGHHIGGSEGAGVVWAVGDGVRHVRVGERVTLSSCRWDEDDPEIRLGRDPMLSATQRVWGYELNWGSFAQFTLVAEFQCHPKPARLTWEEASCFMLSGATAYRQLAGWPPHTVQPGDPVLVWGGSGGLGSMACQLVRQFGGRAIAVVSSAEREKHCMRMGAVGVINRTEFDHWGPTPEGGPELERWQRGVRAFGRRIWDLLGEKASPRIVFEHPGRDTLPTSLYVCAPGGMVVLCGATSGYMGDVDLRILWMRQKRFQGSHFANPRDCRAVVDLVAAGLVDPALGHTYGFEEIGSAHQDMRDGVQESGNLAALVGAPRAGLTDLDG